MPRQIGRSSRATLLTLAIGLATPMIALPVHAQPPAPPSAEAKKEAEAIFQTGLKYYDAREFERARVEFKKAYGLYASAGILRNLALSELYSNHAIEALRHLQEYVGRPEVEQAKKDDAKKYIDEAYAKTGHLKITATSGVALIVGDRTYSSPLAGPIDVQSGNVTVIARG